MTASKAELRAAILAARRRLTAAHRDAEAQALSRHAADLVVRGDTVCAYVPVGSEPGSLELLETLRRGGARVLLPVAREDDAGVPQPLSWGEYVPGELVSARFGLREPKAPWLAPEVVADAATLLVPSLAVDRSGVRLGRGAGFYDRTLHLASRSARLIAVVRDEELVERLPADPHDIPMTHALTPVGGLQGLGAPE